METVLRSTVRKDSRTGGGCDMPVVEVVGLLTVVVLTGLAGAAVPLGGAAARAFRMPEGVARTDVLHGMIAFGGGALLAAVALILVPEGVRGMSVVTAVSAFGGGAVAFMLIDRAIEIRGGQYAQLMAMVMDAVPESLALGAVIAAGESSIGPLLAVLIGVQNFPEGFNAYGDLRRAGRRSGAALSALAVIAVAAVIAGLAGFLFLADEPQTLGVLMVFASGGIVYLIFHDIAPEAHQKGHWMPTLGAIVGFALGLAGAVGTGVM